MKRSLLLLCCFFLAALNVSAQSQKLVLLDHYFNHEKQVDKKTGQSIDFHYLWEETDLNGFSMFGDEFKKRGAKTALLDEAPTLQNLKKASVYIIVDPDTKKENPDLKYIQPEHIKAIESWVKAGGTLLLMGNDTANCEITHFNALMARFGMKFLPELQNHVEGKNWEQGAIMVPAGNPVFTTAKKIYMKDISAIEVKSPAKSLLSKNNFVAIATASVGKGRVMAVGDPWLYNEYVSHMNLGTDFQNQEAAGDLAKWLLTHH
ncbi:MAG: hypothetical protein INR69_22785 [Mucilaginibacter polytrichastri]|nr:hypothetical protein [Mucilaginibacter polytrichastri]